MVRYGNIRFIRRVVVALCMLLVSVSVLMPAQIVHADSSYDGVYTVQSDIIMFGKNYISGIKANITNASSPIVTCIAYYKVKGSSTKYAFYYISSKNSFDESHVSVHFADSFGSLGDTYTNSYIAFSCWGDDLKNPCADVFINSVDSFESQNEGNNFFKNKFDNYIQNGVASGDMQFNVSSHYKPTDKTYNEIGCLDNVQMETYVTNKKELIDADENADLSKINQDKVIVYSSSTTTGIDLSKGGYKVQLYGSYAWQDKSGNIKSEDKGHKTFIKDWYAENNIKGLNRSKYTWIDWKTANDKVETDKTDKAHKPNVFEKMTTYANYQYEPIWYLRIVSQDNKYGAWVKLYNSSKKGKYTSEAVDDNDNSVSDSDGGYSKPKDTSEITGTGDTPEDAKNNVQKTEEKQDNKDIQDASGGSNSTFDKLEEFTKGIGDVPKMIADIFSFLPSWCLEVVAIGFALLMILIVVKFIRG